MKPLSVILLTVFFAIITILNALQCYSCRSKEACQNPTIETCPHSNWTCTMYWVSGKAIEGGCNGPNELYDGCYMLPPWTVSDNTYQICTTEEGQPPCNDPNRECTPTMKINEKAEVEEF